MSYEEMVIKILKKISDTEVTDINNDLKKDLAIDSLGRVLLLVEIEESCCIKLDESDMNPFKLNTVADVIKLVAKYCGDLK